MSRGRRTSAFVTLPGKPVPPASGDELPEGFKMTELGPLPEKWEVVSLGELFEIQQGKALSPRARAGARKRPFLRTANVLWGRLDLSVLDEMHFDEEEEARLALIPGDLLVCEGGDIGRTAIWEGELPLVLYQNHLHRLRAVRGGVDPLFYMYWMQAAWSLLGLYGGAGNKTTIPNLSRSRLAAFAVPVPHLSEQRAIAHVLRTVQRAKEATERVIAALKELKKSLMQHLFTYGPVPVTEREHVALQESEIGPLPAHWRVVRLGEVVYHVRDTVNPMSYPDERFEYYSIPAYQSGQQPALETGREIRSVKIVVQSGTVLFGKLNPRVPKIWLVESASPRRKIASTEFIALVPNHVQLDSSFLYFLSWTPFVLSKAQELIAGSTPSRQRVDVRAFLQLPIPLPPLDEQREIACILQAVDARIAAEEARRAALEALFKTLLHGLMTARRRLPGRFIAQFSKGTGHG